MLASATQQCESATGIHISLPSWTSLPTPHLITPPSVVAEYHPMWCSNFPLVIYFTNGNMFQYHCQFAPPSLSPEGSKVCFLCLSLHCCFANRYSSVFLSGVHIYVLIYDISFLFLIYFTHITGSVEQVHPPQYNWFQVHPFYGQYSIIYTYHSFFIYSSVDRYTGCFHVLATVNSATMNFGVHVSFSIMVFSGDMPRSGIAGS